MIELLKEVVQPAMLPYTVLLGLCMFYWLVVILGFLDMDFLDVGLGLFDGAADGAAEGAADALAEGAAEAVADAAVEGAAEGAVEAAGEGVSGTFQAVLAFLSLGTVPATILLSILVFAMWLLALLFTRLLPDSLHQAVHPLIVGVVLFLFALSLGLVLTGLTSRPLRKLFEHRPVHGHSHLIGKVCQVKSSTVTPTFGQAECRVQDSFLLLSVRTEEGTTLGRGEQAVVIDYDKEKDVYEICEMPEELRS